MLDSLEDYVRISEKSKPKVKTISPETHINIQKKKECEARAMKIVEFLIDGKLRTESFLNCLKHINQAHYQDIVEERAISKLCGYCLCGNKIPEMPKKQYHISTKRNKIYDITDRKNFCSNTCYESSVHIKKQVDTSPLWLRKPQDYRQFNVLFTPNGLPGEEVDQGLVKTESDDKFTPVSVFTEASLDEVIESEVNKEKSRANKKASGNKTNNAVAMDTIKELEEEQLSVTQNENQNNPKESSNADEKWNSATLQLKEHIEPVTEKKSQIITKRQPVKSNKTQSQPTTDVLLFVKNCLHEWLTLETFMFIHGEQKVKEVLSERKLSEYFDKLKIDTLQTSQQIKYMNICKKLQLREIADAKFDSAVTGKTLNPIPDYGVLKGESKTMDLKVKSFYGGALYEQEDQNFSSKKKDEDTEVRVLPLISKTSQAASRRKIYLSSINRVISNTVEALDLGEFEIRGDIQSLIKTFKLEANNTVFKPLVWNIIAIALIHILSVRDKLITCKLQEKKQLEYIGLLLKSFGDHQKFLNDIENIVTNIDDFVESYVTKID